MDNGINFRDTETDYETAEADFMRFCDEWEIDTDTDTMTDEDVTGFNNQKRLFIKAVQKGRLHVNEDGTLTYTFSDKSEKKVGEKITIKRPKGSAYMEMDGFKEKEMIRKTYSVIASMTGKTVGYFAGIDGIDLKPLQAVITLFLAG